MKDKTFCAKLFDKKDNFTFLIVRMANLDINIPSKNFYSAFGAEILRPARPTIDATIMIDRMIKKEGKMNRFSTTPNKLFARHFDVFHKCNNTSLEFVESLLILYNLIIYDLSVYRTDPMQTFPIVVYLTFNVAECWYSRTSFQVLEF